MPLLRACGFVCRYRLPEEQVRDAVETALELVNMKQFMHRATHTLSGGQRQRVAIAGACMLLVAHQIP
jgi:energy-coupling factor transporter ATP-binding protein EcfA2